jgi:hypothetical protein
MPVVGDVAHVVVDPELAEAGRRHLAEAMVHVGDVTGRGLGPVPPPHHHGHGADLALGDPAHVVLVVPGGEARGAAEIAGREGAPLRRAVGHVGKIAAVAPAGEAG